MANLIVEGSQAVSWYTDLYPFFSLVEPTIRQHIWLWSDIDLNTELPIECKGTNVCWISGDSLFDFIRKRPQIKWSVLSAIPATLKAAASSSTIIPFADGNPDLWHGNPSPQHPLAAFEIVCWDSSATILIDADANLATAFRSAYPAAADLDDENRRQTGRIEC